MTTENLIDVDEFIAKFADAIDGVEPASVTPKTKLNEIAEWDSLAVLVTITMADTDYEVDLNGKEVNNCETVQDLIDLVANKRNA